MTFALNVRLSDSVTVISDASRTTWLLVRMRPSESNRKPEPDDGVYCGCLSGRFPPPPPGGWPNQRRYISSMSELPPPEAPILRRVSMLTTAGAARSTTATNGLSMPGSGAIVAAFWYAGAEMPCATDSGERRSVPASASPSTSPQVTKMAAPAQTRAGPSGERSFDMGRDLLSARRRPDAIRTNTFMLGARGDGGQGSERPIAALHNDLAALSSPRVCGTLRP